MDIVEILTYFCETQDVLSEEDWNFLRATAFMKDKNGITRMAKELHFSSSTLDMLPFPILQFPARISGAIEDFLIELGVKKNPTLSAIFGILTQNDISEDIHMATFK